MKKYIKIALVYAVLAMASGVFYREFTKFNEFTAKTALSVTHLHLFVLGTVVFLLIGLLAGRSNLETLKLFRPTIIVYNVGLPFMVIMFYVRGILQVLGTNLGNGADLAVSGVAGIGHILMATGIVLLFISLLKADYRKQEKLFSQEKDLSRQPNLEQYE